MAERITNIKRTITVEGEQEEPRPVIELGTGSSRSILSAVLGCIVLSAFFVLVLKLLF